MRILIVDDDRNSVDQLVALLATAGHDVRVEADARAGADAVATWQPDVALLDIGLPDNGAYLVARRARAERPTHATRLVALAEWGQQEDRRRSVKAGFDHHLVKPVDPLHLKVLLNSVGSSVHATAGSARKG